MFLIRAPSKLGLCLLGLTNVSPLSLSLSLPFSLSLSLSLSPFLSLSHATLCGNLRSSHGDTILSVFLAAVEFVSIYEIGEFIYTFFREVPGEADTTVSLN